MWLGEERYVGCSLGWGGCARAWHRSGRVHRMYEWLAQRTGTEEDAQVGETYLNNLQSFLPACPLIVREDCKWQPCDLRALQPIISTNHLPSAQITIT